jgi:general secretion pathway protein G
MMKGAVRINATFDAPLGYRTRRRYRATGFSLIELLVVIAIMGVLASVGLPLAELSRQRTKEEDLRRSLREIRTALDAYKQLVDVGSIQRAADGSGYPPSLEILASGVDDARSPQRTKLYLLRKLPRDPFASVESSSAETWALRSYASPPDAPAPGKDVFDVHSMAAGVGLNGVPYSQW